MRRDAKVWAGSSTGRAATTVYRLGSTMIPIPRHRELDDSFAEKVFKEGAPELGDRWWK